MPESEQQRSFAELDALADSLLRGRTDVSILVAMSPQEPRHAVAALLDDARKRDIRVTLYTADLSGSFAFLSEQDLVDIEQGRIRVIVVAGSAPRRLAAQADALPVSIWDAERMARNGELAVDVYAVRTADGGTGRIDLGSMVGFTPALFENEKTAVLVELSTDDDFTRGLYLTALPDRALAWVAPPAGTSKKRGSPASAGPSVHDVIAGHVASVVPDRATVQLGMGSLADALVRELAQKEGIGFHGGTLPGAALQFIERGRFAGEYKDVDAGLQVATGVAPDAGADRWPDSVRLRPIAETHDPNRLALHSCLWAINSALSVDLFGQVNAEWLAGVRMASGGGQTDFMRAAHASARGAAVIALPSRSSHGHSRIVRALQHPGVVTTTGNDIDYVVTEWGVALLTGRSAMERRQAIVGIAHPDDRRGLLDSGSAR